MFGKKAQAEKLFNSLKEKAKHEYIPPVFFFSMYKVRGDIDQAFEWFERACEDCDIYLPFCLNWPDCSMRVPDDKKFTELLKKWD